MGINNLFKKTALTAALFMLTSCATLPVIPKFNPQTYQKTTLEGRLRTGVAKNKIISEIDKDSKIPIAGYGPNFKDKIAEGIHDDVYTRAIILDNGYKKIGIVNADVVIITKDLKQAVEEKVREAKLDGLLIVATHNHSGPGGYVDNYLAEVVCTGDYQKKLFNNLVDKISKTIIEVDKDLKFSKIGSGKDSIHGISRSRRAIETKVDYEVGVIKVDKLDGKVKAYIVNFAAHPTSLGKDNRHISADFPGYLSMSIEEKFGGTAIFFNGALGGMVTPQVEGHDFKDAEKTGLRLYETVLNALEKSELVHDPKISFKQKKFKLYVNNWKFLLLKKLSIIKRKEYEPKCLMTEISLIRIGPAELVTIPGEAFPSIGFWLKEQMNEKYKFVIGLGNDEIGYIMTRKEFKDKLYSYEQSMSLGKKTWQSIKTELQTLLD